MIESAAKVVEADFDRLNTFVINARYNEPTVPIANSDLGAKWWKTWTVVSLTNRSKSAAKTAADTIPGYTWTLPLDLLFPTSILKEGNKQIVSLPSVSANLILSGFQNRQTSHHRLPRVHQR